jgi:osmoprotectant transport system substrate-binding protein
MRNAVFIAIMFLFFSPRAEACVGKTLKIGVIDSSEGQVLAEMISALINERTGTTVTVSLYKNEQALYEAVKVKEVDISIENTTRAMHMLNMPVEPDAKKAYEIVKTTYEKEKGLIWLKPFGFQRSNGGGSPSYTATILRDEILNNFPALPRLINKLGSTVNDEMYAKLIKSVESGGKPKDVARDFLKSKKLI